MCIKRWLVLPSNRDGEEQKAIGKTKDRHTCMCTFLYEAMAQDDKLIERKVKTVGKDDFQFGAVCFSERTFVILMTIVKDKDVRA